MVAKSKKSAQPVPALAELPEKYRLLAEMAEQSTDMISRHTPGDWRFIYASPAVTHLLGYSVEEVIGLSAYELYHPDDAEDFQKRAPSVSYERGLYTHTYRFRHKDGRYLWLESTSRSIRDPITGELQEILVVSRDVSRRVQAEAATRRMARVLEISQDLVVFFDPDGRVSYLNEAARQRLRLAHPELSGLLLQDLFSEQSFRLLQQSGLPQAAEQGRWIHEAGMVGPEQRREIPVVLEVLAHRSAGDDLEYYSLVAHDLSERRAAEEAARRHQAAISQASRLISVGEMASGLAHELNQPLTAISNYVQGIQRLFKRDPAPSLEELEMPLQRIGKTALRCGEIIHRVRNFARKGEIQRQPQMIAEVVEEVIKFCDPEALRRGIRLSNRVEHRLPAVRADRVQLEQVLLNLLLNAIEACEHVSEARRCVFIDAVQQASEEGNEQVIIRVHDEGPGIAPEAVDQLFEQFFTTKPKGLGMGLSISRSLVEAHRGRLWAENNQAGGATFSIALPVDDGH